MRTKRQTSTPTVHMVICTVCTVHTYVHMHVLPKRDIDVGVCVCSSTTKAGKDSHKAGLDPTTYNAL